MANPVSFDITSSVDLQEVDNAVNQARKEVAQRYDFKGSRAAIDLNREREHDHPDRRRRVQDDGAVGDPADAAWSGAACPTKNLTPGEIERAANDTVRRVVTLQQGIPTEAAKDIVKFLKDQKLKKVQAAILADQVRVTSAVEGRAAGSDAAAARARLRRARCSSATTAAEALAEGPCAGDSARARG